MVCSNMASQSGRLGIGGSLPSDADPGSALRTPHLCLGLVGVDAASTSSSVQDIKYQQLSTLSSYHGLGAADSHRILELIKTRI